MFGKKQLPTGDELKTECERRGINVDNIYHQATGRITGPAQREMQQLILDFDAVGRERLMITLTAIAVIAASVGTFSALYAVFWS